MRERDELRVGERENDATENLMGAIRLVDTPIKRRERNTQAIIITVIVNANIARFVHSLSFQLRIEIQPDISTSNPPSSSRHSHSRRWSKCPNYGKEEH